MNTTLKLAVMTLVAATSVGVMAQDVNNPTGTLLDRPLGPTSAPGVMVNGQQVESVIPSADPNRSLEGRATTPPRVVRQPQGASNEIGASGGSGGSKPPQAGANK